MIWNDNLETVGNWKLRLAIRLIETEGKRVVLCRFEKEALVLPSLIGKTGEGDRGLVWWGWDCSRRIAIALQERKPENSRDKSFLLWQVSWGINVNSFFPSHLSLSINMGKVQWMKSLFASFFLEKDNCLSGLREYEMKEVVFRILSSLLCMHYSSPRLIFSLLYSVRSRIVYTVVSGRKKEVDGRRAKKKWMDEREAARDVIRRSDGKRYSNVYVTLHVWTWQPVIKWSLDGDERREQKRGECENDDDSAKFPVITDKGTQFAKTVVEAYELHKMWVWGTFLFFYLLKGVRMRVMDEMWCPREVLSCVKHFPLNKTVLLFPSAILSLQCSPTFIYVVKTNGVWVQAHDSLFHKKTVKRRQQPNFWEYRWMQRPKQDRKGRMSRMTQSLLKVWDERSSSQNKLFQEHSDVDLGKVHLTLEKETCSDPSGKETFPRSQNCIQIAGWTLFNSLYRNRMSDSKNKYHRQMKGRVLHHFFLFSPTKWVRIRHS